MDRHAGKIVLNGATSQSDRWLEALDEGYAPVDARSLVDLLNFPGQFGRLINFYDLSDTSDGDWRPFFAQDPTMILAAIIALDLSRDEAAFLALERRTLGTKSERKFDFLVDMFAQTIALARDLNGWLVALHQGPERAMERLLRRQIVAMIETDLGAELRRLVAYAEGARLPEALGRRIPLDLAGFLPIWDLSCDCPDGSIWRGRSSGRKIDHACPAITAVFFAFLDALLRLQTFARANLAASLAEADHPPHIALYIAFAELFQTAQATINTMSGRYVNFYYHDILRETFRAAAPDHVYLTLTLASDQGSGTTVPRGTLFSAGPDSTGIDVLYAADKSLFVSPVSIAKLRTVRVARSPLVDAGEEVTRQIFGSDIVMSDQDGSPWATFGEPHSEQSTRERTALATLGFAIASPYLLLTGGKRRIELTLTYSQASAQSLASRLSIIADATRLAPDVVFEDLLKGAFEIFVSTASAWLKIDDYNVVLGQTSIELDLVLPPSAPPLVAYGPIVANDMAGGADPDPTLPTLKAYLKQAPVAVGEPPHSLDVYPLSLLENLDLTDWSLDTSINDLSDLQLSNTAGAVDPGAPFLPFGAPPVLGSYLDIAAPELFAKTLTSLDIAITWFDLPQNKDGFKGWYRDYVIGMDGKPQTGLFDNTTFKAGICVVNRGRWNLAKEAHSDDPAVCALGAHDLFRTMTPEADRKDVADCTRAYAAGRLCASTAFVELPFLPPQTPRNYYDPADSAIRVQLTAPVYAFGDVLYTQNVLDAVIGDLPDPKAADAGPVRCQPWKILCDAAQWIDACIESCDKSEDYPTCMAGGLRACVTRIEEAAFACLLNGLAEAEGALGDERSTSLRSELRALTEPDATTRAAQIRHWIEKTEGDPTLPASLAANFVRCLMLLGAVVCIETCRSEAAGLPSDKYKASITACLTTCMQRLRQPYEDCCKDLKYPNPPWLPQATGVSLTYTAKCSWTTDAAAGQFYHLLPFDSYAVLPRAAAGVPLLPRYPAGSLYIGLADLVPPQSLTLLFEMTAGASDWSDHPQAVTWSVLDRSGWTALMPANLLADGTNGLQNSGILALGLPSFDAGNTVLDPDLHWLAASVEQGASSFPMTSRITPHALLATWQDNGSIAHLSAPLPADTITGAVENLPAIATVTQPIESFGGRPPETGRSFRTWLGERLRHKDRGILAWDYERLVLEAFPTVWKVQALPARNGRGAAPGGVLVVVVPGPDSVDVMDPTAPVASIDVLGRIGASLEASVGPFVRLEVANPVYVRITVTVVAQFYDMEDPGVCIKQLDDDLVRYLSPWPDGAERAAKGGDYASEDEISDFIQTRPYVEAVLSLDFVYAPDPDGLDWYFLTSARQHRMEAADADPAAARRFTATALEGRPA